jgi:DNA-binding response OmpR family regulator
MSKRVLLIDDEENIRQMTRLTLETAGNEVGEAGSGMEAFAILGGDDAWDVVLLDQKMPGMVGTDVLRRFKVMAPQARVIMMTAFASIELAVEAMRLGATDFVRKPMTPEVLRNAIAAALAKPEAAAATEPIVTQPSDETATTCPRALIQTITMNGFEITRPTNKQVSPALEPDEHRFIVRSPDGKEREVIIKIDEDAVSYVKQMTRRHILPNSDFWLSRAERLLSNFLWNEGKLPANGRLTVSDVDRDGLIVAERWEDD